MSFLERWFGPIVVWDALRGARRKGAFVWRASLAGIFAVTLFALDVTLPTLGWSYPSMAVDDAALVISWGALVIAIDVAIDFAETAIPLERKRRTLELLLTTPISESELLWNKWLSNVAFILFYEWSLVGVVMIMDAHDSLNLATLALTALVTSCTASSCVAVGILCSAKEPTPESARSFTMHSLLGFLAAPYALSLLCLSIGQWAADLGIPLPQHTWWTAPTRFLGWLLCSAESFELLHQAYLGTTMSRLSTSLGSTSLAPSIVVFAVTHIILTAHCLRRSVRLLRSFERGEPEPLATVAPNKKKPSDSRPPVWDDPMLWREMMKLDPKWTKGHL